MGFAGAGWVVSYADDGVLADVCVMESMEVLCDVLVLSGASFGETRLLSGCELGRVLERGDGRWIAVGGGSVAKFWMGRQC